MASARLRLFQVLLVVLINVFSTGIIFGFAGLKPLLIRKGVYSWLCHADREWETSRELSCDRQELHLNNMFVLAVALTNMASLPAGSVLDRFGPRKTSILGATIFGIGNLVFGSGYTSWPIVLDGYYIGFCLLAIGSPLIFLSSFHISNAFPSRSGLVLSLVMAGFNASSVCYVLFDWIDRKANISVQALFWCYSLIPALFIMLQLLAGPRLAYEKRQVSQTSPATVSAVPASNYGATSTSDSPSREPTSSLPSSAAGSDPFVAVLSSRSLVDQLRSRHFVALLVFFTIYADRINWEIQTISEQLTFYLGDPDVVARTVTKFAIFLPLGGILGVPLFGWLLDRRSTFDVSIVILAAGLVYGVLGMVRSTVAQVVSVSVFVVLRPLLYIFVGDYCGKAFGFKTFGRVYGLLNTLIGLFSLILGPIDHLVKNELHGNYDLINAAWLVLGLIASCLLSWSIYRVPKPTERSVHV